MAFDEVEAILCISSHLTIKSLSVLSSPSGLDRQMEWSVARYNISLTSAIIFNQDAFVHERRRYN